MLVPSLVMGVLAATLLLVGFHRGEGEHLRGLGVAYKMTLEILPLLVLAFIVAGMVQTLLPRELVARWVGGESGLRGILIGCVAGSVAPGGPFVSFPIAAGLLGAGAGIGTTVAFITAWSLIGVNRIPLEVGTLGWRFVGVRLACTFFFPPIAGLIAQSLFSKKAGSM